MIMMSDKIKYFGCVLILFAALSAESQNNNVFSDNEKLVFTGAYSLGFIYTEVAEVNLQMEKMVNRTNEYRVVGTGNTYKFYDRVFKVRDTYETRFLAPSFTSQYFHRDIYEGGYTMKNTYWFNWDDKKITGTMEKKNSTEHFLLSMEPGKPYSDVLTCFYSFRNKDFSKIKVNDKYPFYFILDNEFFSIQCKYLGKETRKSKYLGGTINCMKFNLEVVAGEVFKGDETITVWMSDDQNRLPIEIECPIRIGKIKAYLKSYENIKYPINFVSK